jgi:heme A synthase
MTRIVAEFVVPFLLPTALYMAWMWYRARYVAQHGGEVPKIEQGPWAILLFLGAVLTMAILAVSALTRGGDASSVYTPPHLENGQVVPGHMDERRH